MKREDTEPEREFRHILEELKLPISSQVEGDFTTYCWVWEIHGDFKKGKQSKLNNTAWKESELRKLGFYPFPIWQEELKHKRELVKETVRLLTLLRQA